MKAGRNIITQEQRYDWHVELLGRISSIAGMMRADAPIDKTSRGIEAYISKRIIPITRSVLERLNNGRK